MWPSTTSSHPLRDTLFICPSCSHQYSTASNQAELWGCLNLLWAIFLYHQDPVYSDWDSGKKGISWDESEECEHIGHIISLCYRREKRILCSAIMCAKFMLTAETRINTFHIWRRGGMLQVKHVSFWMLQQAADMYRNLQIPRQEFFLNFKKLSTLSLRAEGILQEQQAPSARCMSTFTASPELASHLLKSLCL